MIAAFRQSVDHAATKAEHHRRISEHPIRFTLGRLYTLMEQDKNSYQQATIQVVGFSG